MYFVRIWCVGCCCVFGLVMWGDLLGRDDVNVRVSVVLLLVLLLLMGEGCVKRSCLVVLGVDDDWFLGFLFILIYFVSGGCFVEDGYGRSILVYYSEGL